MNNHWLVFGGWSLPPEILSPVFGNEATYIDVNRLFTHIFAEDRLRENWAQIIFTTIKHVIPNRIVHFAGWSTGAFFAYAFSSIVKPQKMLLLSVSPSFCKRDDFVHGQDSVVVKAMRRQLTRDKFQVFRNFQKQCGLEVYDAASEKYSLEELTSGLRFLEQISLMPLGKTTCPTFLFHGKEDAIIPWQAGDFFADETGAAQTILPGGHVFFLDDSNALVVRNAMNK